MNNRNKIIAGLAILAFALMSFGKKPEGTVEVGEGEFGEPETDGDFRDNSGRGNSGGQTRVPVEREDTTQPVHQNTNGGTSYGSGGSRTNLERIVSEVDLISSVVPQTNYVDRSYDGRLRTLEFRANEADRGCRTCL